MTHEELEKVKDALESVATRLERYHIIGTDDRAALQKAKSAIKLLRKEAK